MALVNTIIFSTQIVTCYSPRQGRQGLPVGNYFLIMIKERNLIKNLNLMILYRIIFIYEIAFDGFPWESYFLASIPDLSHQKVLACPKCTQKFIWQPPAGPAGRQYYCNLCQIKKKLGRDNYEKCFSKIPMFFVSCSQEKNFAMPLVYTIVF
jgi:hypothetical protein